jgi:hypothetical protein
MSRVINYIKCARCEKEWVEEESDGICEKCEPELEVDLLVADLWKISTTLISMNTERIRPHRKTIGRAVDSMLAKVKKL